MLVLAACGGGASSGSGGAEPLSKREYIVQADALKQDAESVFASSDGRLPATPAKAAAIIGALDAMIAGYEALEPPRDWRDEHEAIVAALGQMRDAVGIVARASARNEGAIRFQVARYQQAQADLADAVRSINASR